MRPVDYSEIAKTYDLLPIRTVVPVDERLGACLARAVPARVLDVGCGTGTWLAAQLGAYESLGASWFGVDPSEAMLERARAKVPQASLSIAPAESLPFPERHFRFVSSRFTFHHFADKPRAVSELVRVLEQGGMLSIMNIVPERMPGWWVFRFFPEARDENARYWSPSRLADELEGRGLAVRMEVNASGSEISLGEALRIARTRDQSHLFALEDDVYEARLADLEAASQRDPDRRVATESAVLKLYASA